MNEKGVLQFAENLIEGTVSYYVRKKKVSMESDDQNSRISPNNFQHKNFYQPNVNSMDFFNEHFKNWRHLSNK